MKYLGDMVQVGSTFVNGRVGDSILLHIPSILGDLDYIFFKMLSIGMWPQFFSLSSPFPNFDIVLCLVMDQGITSILSEKTFELVSVNEEGESQFVHTTRNS